MTSNHWHSLQPTSKKDRRRYRIILVKSHFTGHLKVLGKHTQSAQAQCTVAYTQGGISLKQWKDGKVLCVSTDTTPLSGVEF
jgi:hypothetical protein